MRFGMEIAIRPWLWTTDNHPAIKLFYDFLPILNPFVNSFSAKLSILANLGMQKLKSLQMAAKLWIFRHPYSFFGS
ncbi:hypothetical protein CQ054_06715 [Ochrobactrum sp. MYb29]|nr:hypothetical protein CQ054_06715 [Ochrobactrum sp. MYb29]